MTDNQWNAFNEYKITLKCYCDKWNTMQDLLFPLQKAAADKDNVPEYPLETAVVYNTAYDELTKDDEIHYIVIGDNPGKDEQKLCNQKYFVGQAGKLGAGFFRNNPEHNTDFRKNVIISNKTPVHSAKTMQLKYLAKNGGEQIADLIRDSQITLAKMTAKLHQSLIAGCDNESFIPELWLVGYGELKKNGIFTEYRETLKNCYKKPESAENDITMIDSWDKVKVYQHFSMNCFTKDLAKFKSTPEGANLTTKECLAILGTTHRKEIFSC